MNTAALPLSRCWKKRLGLECMLKVQDIFIGIADTQGGLAHSK